MLKICTVFLLLLTVSCANFERRLADDLVKSGQIKLNRCEVEGFNYSGIDSYLTKGKLLKVLMIHGIGTHHPGYSRLIQQNLADSLGLNVISRQPKNISLLDPSDNHAPIGNLRITFWQNHDRSKNMLFYELTWSEITAPYKKILSFDTSEQYSEFRVPFNNSMKVFLDNALPDPLIYIADKHDLIVNSGKQAICWMINTNWDDIPNNQAKVCNMSLEQEINGLADENVIFITHSLGSKILMDAITQIADNIALHENTASFRQAVSKLQNKEITIFMLANQLPILHLDQPLPRVHNQISAYCQPQGAHYRQRVFKHVNIVAFSDPNDILSYAIPQNFADKYIDSRMCPLVTNVSVNVAPEISAFGIGVVSPVEAHVNYDRSPKVINLITHGTANFREDKVLEQQCRFIQMKNDKTMTWLPH